MPRRSSARSTFTTALLAGPLALALVACGGEDPRDVAADLSTASQAPAVTEATTDLPQTPAETPAETSAQTPAETAPRTAGAGALLAAARTALAELDGATVFSIDGETTGWDVTLVAADGTESDVDVSPDGASVTRGPVVDTDDDPSDEAEDVAERRRLLADARLDLMAAVEAARAAVPNALVTGADLELDNGIATWDVQFDEDTPEEQTVTIDAVTGDVLRVELDD